MNKDSHMVVILGIRCVVMIKTITVLIISVYEALHVGSGGMISIPERYSFHTNIPTYNNIKLRLSK